MLIPIDHHHHLLLVLHLIIELMKKILRLLRIQITFFFVRKKLREKLKVNEFLLDRSQCKSHKLRIVLGHAFQQSLVHRIPEKLQLFI